MSGGGRSGKDLAGVHDVVGIERALDRPHRFQGSDIDAALQTASAIGDDMLQRKAQGRVVPDSFTHGTSEQRKRWFSVGFQQGSVAACNTFAGQV